MGSGRFAQGMIQVYTGDGKGKTTAALGLACRAVGHGFQVIMIQFLKGNMEYGEIETAKKLAPCLTIKQMGRGCLLNRSELRYRDLRRNQRGRCFGAGYHGCGHEAAG